MTGFVKFISVCPTAGSKISLQASVDTTQFSSGNSNTTLHVYFFDVNSNVLKIAPGYPLHRGSLTSIGLFDSLVPTGTRRIALAPMAFIDPSEQSSIFYHMLSAQYEPANVPSLTELANDGFSSFDATTKQPMGWSDFGGDWFAMSPQNFATVWNPSWSDGASTGSAVDTGMEKTFTFSAAGEDELLDASLFVASTFSDPQSFVRLRLLFDDGSFLESDRTGGSTYGNVFLRRAELPVGARSVRNGD